MINLKLFTHHLIISLIFFNLKFKVKVKIKKFYFANLKLLEKQKNVIIESKSKLTQYKITK